MARRGVNDEGRSFEKHAASDAVSCDTIYKRNGWFHRPARSLATMALCVWSLVGCAELDQSLKILGTSPSGGLTEAKMVAGLKEALQVGVGNASALLGRPGGFLKNQAVKILMPEKLQSFEKSLRMIGFEPQLDEFVQSMNHAAERASMQAKPIFVSAIKEMNIADAKRILSGGDTAATEYFRSKTSIPLAAAFKPEVDKAMNEFGVTKQYKDLVGRFQALPFADKTQILSIDHYVVTKTLDGLFLTLGEEERKIRTNPAARVTELLKDVFKN